jgi:hypothetical protein
MCGAVNALVGAKISGVIYAALAEKPHIGFQSALEFSRAFERVV